MPQRYKVLTKITDGYLDTSIITADNQRQAMDIALCRIASFPDYKVMSVTPVDTTEAQKQTSSRKNASFTTAPKTVEEAENRIRFLNLNLVTGEIDGLYHNAIKRYLLSENDISARMALDWCIMIAYGIGVQEGKRRERQHRKQKSANTRT